MEFTLYQLEVFNAVVVSGSITKAAKRLRVSQPTVTRQLAKLEEILDAQLLRRDRRGQATLTHAGDFWHKNTLEILSEKNKVIEEHKSKFVNSALIRLGIVPNFRGGFISKVARIMQKNSDHMKFELIYDSHSERLVDKLKMHQLDFAIVDRSAIENDIHSFHVSNLFEDKFAWAVPSSIKEKYILEALKGNTAAYKMAPALGKHVEVQLPTLVKGKCENWFKNYLPNSTASFSAPTWTAAIELVADGLATSHIVLSLLPYQQKQIINSINLFELKDIKTNMVLATKKHLMTQKSYRDRHLELVNFCRNEHTEAIKELQINSIPINSAAF